MAESSKTILQGLILAKVTSNFYAKCGILPFLFYTQHPPDKATERVLEYYNLKDIAEFPDFLVRLYVFLPCGKFPILNHNSTLRFPPFGVPDANMDTKTRAKAGRYIIKPNYEWFGVRTLIRVAKGKAMDEIKSEVWKSSPYLLHIHQSIPCSRSGCSTRCSRR